MSGNVVRDPVIGRGPVTAADLRATLAALPQPDRQAMAATQAREATLTKPAGALGRLETLTVWLAGWQGRHPPRLDRPLVCVFAGNHGVAAQGVSAFPADVTAQMVENFRNGGAAINQLCQIADAQLQVFELALDSPTTDFTRGPALGETACLAAIAYGMTRVEPDSDLLATGEMGIGNTTAAAAICHALYGGTAADWTGPGTGIASPALARKTDIVASAVHLHRQRCHNDPLAVLACLGGHEIAAMAGAILGARMHRVPVLLDGYVSTAAAAILAAINPDAIAHCRAAHRSAEPAHAQLLDRLGMTPLLDLDMRLGEASGAALAIPVIRAALACHTGMATFTTAKVQVRCPD